MLAWPDDCEATRMRRRPRKQHPRRLEEDEQSTTSVGSRTKRLAGAGMKRRKQGVRVLAQPGSPLWKDRKKAAEKAKDKEQPDFGPGGPERSFHRTKQFAAVRSKAAQLAMEWQEDDPEGQRPLAVDAFKMREARDKPLAEYLKKKEEEEEVPFNPWDTEYGRHFTVYSTVAHPVPPPVIVPSPSPSPPRKRKDQIPKKVIRRKGGKVKKRALMRPRRKKKKRKTPSPPPSTTIEEEESEKEEVIHRLNVLPTPKRSPKGTGGVAELLCDPGLPTRTFVVEEDHQLLDDDPYALLPRYNAQVYSGRGAPSAGHNHLHYHTALPTPCASCARDPLGRPMCGECRKQQLCTVTRFEPLQHRQHDPHAYRFLPSTVRNAIVPAGGEKSEYVAKKLR